HWSFWAAHHLNSSGAAVAKGLRPGAARGSSAVELGFDVIASNLQIARTRSMRTRLGTICLLASALLITPSASHAQGKKPAAGAAAKDPKKGKEADKGAQVAVKPKEIKLEDEQEGPVTAGQMTEEAAQGKRLFDAERWSESALVLKRVVDGET